MPYEQWLKERKRLQAAVTRAKTKARSMPSLAEKIEAKRLVVVAEEALFMHKFNYHKLLDNTAA